MSASYTSIGAASKISSWTIVATAGSAVAATTCFFGFFFASGARFGFEVFFAGAFARVGFFFFAGIGHLATEERITERPEREPEVVHSTRCLLLHGRDCAIQKSPRCVNVQATRTRER